MARQLSAREGTVGWGERGPSPLAGHGATIQLILLGLAAAGIALLPLPYNAAAAVGLATVLLTLLRPTWGLYLVILSVPIQDVAAPRIGEVAITATKVMVPLALVAWLALRLWRGGWRLTPAALTVPYGLYVAVLTGTIATAVSQPAALTEASRWLQAYGVFLMTLDLVCTRRSVAGLVACLLIGGVSQAVLGLGQSLSGAGPASFAVSAGLSRAYGTFGMPNSYAGYLEMTLPLALALSVWLVGRWFGRRADWRPSLVRRLAWLAVPLAAGLLAAGIFLSFSRGAWLGTLVGLAVMVALAGRRWLISGVVVAAFAAVFLVLGGASLLPSTFSERLTSIVEAFTFRDVRTMVITPSNFALAERMAMWQAGLNMFDAEPIYGVGAGNFNVTYDDYRVPQFRYSRGHAHNYYIHAAAETGLIGLTAYGLVLIAAWLDLGRALRRVRDGWSRALIVGASGILAAVMVHHLGENLHVLNMNLHFFAVLALPALVGRLTASGEEPV